MVVRIGHPDAGHRRAAQHLGRERARRREFLNLLRYLGNELRIPLVGVGTHEAYLAIRSDDQLENRFDPLVLSRWRSDEQARSLLASFAASFPLRRPSPITTPEMADYLIGRSEGTIGELAHLLTDAATAAITSGEEAINATTLRLADYLGPTERAAPSNAPSPSRAVAAPGLPRLGVSSPAARPRTTYLAGFPQVSAGPTIEGRRIGRGQRAPCPGCVVASGLWIMTRDNVRLSDTYPTPGPTRRPGTPEKSLVIRALTADRAR